MKKCSYLFFGLLFTFALGDLYAQPKWQLQSLDIQVPVMTRYSGGGNGDTSEQLIHFDFAANDSVIKSNADSIAIPFSSAEAYGAANGKNIIARGTGSVNFNFDNNRSINNFSIGDYISGSIEVPNSIHTPYVDDFSASRSQSISIPTLYFDSKIISGDTTILTAQVKGKNCKQLIGQASYGYNWTDSWRVDIVFYDSRTTTSYRLSDDTNSYHCFITFVVKDLNSGVIQKNSINQALEISTSLPNKSINFSFPSSDHSQSLTIYDILGREVKRIEIAVGATEYSLPKEQLVSGYYFARLGSQSASSIVN